LRQLLASWLGKPNANTGVDRGETSVGIALGGSGAGYFLYAEQLNARMLGGVALVVAGTL